MIVNLKFIGVFLMTLFATMQARPNKSDLQKSNTNVANKSAHKPLKDHILQRPDLWMSKKISHDKRSYYESLVGVAEPNSEHLKAIDEFQSFLSQRLNHYEYHKLPREFDVRKRWPHCKSIINIIQDQSRCGSCWAVASASAMSDRACIASGGHHRVQISADDLITCCDKCRTEKSDSCMNGYTYSAWQYYQNHGVVTGGTYFNKAGCKPYRFPPASSSTNISEQHVSKCSQMCRDGRSYHSDKHFGNSITFPNTMEQIQHELYNNGPLVVHFEIYRDLVDYQSGVYNHRYGPKIGLHLVKLIGWGEENGVPYWLAQNSWGKNWGDHGLFKIVRGINHLGIERLGVAGDYNYHKSLMNQ